jgi:hypothetical protein
MRRQLEMTFPAELAEQRLPIESELDSGALSDSPPASPPTAPYDHSRLAKERSVRGQFLRDVMATTTLSESDKQSVMRLGLLALDGHDDLEVR